MNLKDFKIESEADDSYHLVHPNGRKFTVEKKGLSKKALEQIQSLACGGRVQNMAEGGTVPAALDPNPPAPAAPDIVAEAMSAPIASQPAQTINPDLQAKRDIYNELVSVYRPPGMGFEFGKAGEPPKRFVPDLWLQAEQRFASSKTAAAESAMADQKRIDAENQARQAAGLPPLEAPKNLIASNGPIPADAIPLGVPADGAQVQSQSVDPMMMKAMETDQMLNQQQGSVGSYMRELERTGAQQQQAYQEFVEAQKRLRTPEQIMEEYRAKDDELLKHYQEQKIDPNRYLKNMGTGSRIVAAIGMALAGMGGGASGKNLALEQINKAIDNDIKAQESDQSKALNLLKLNRERTKDEIQAKILTQNQLLTGVQAKVAMATAASNNAEAKLRGQTLSQQIEQQKMANRQTLALQMAARNGMVSPELLPAEMRQRYVPGFGLATTDANAKAANEKIIAFKSAQSGIGELLSLARKGSSISPTDRARAATVATMLQGQLKDDVVGAGTVSDSDREILKSVAVNPLEISRLSASAQATLKTLGERIGANLDSALGQYGLRPRPKIQEAPPVLRR